MAAKVLLHAKAIKSFYTLLMVEVHKSL